MPVFISKITFFKCVLHFSGVCIMSLLVLKKTSYATLV